MTLSHVVPTTTTVTHASRLFAARAPDHAAHLATFGALPDMTDREQFVAAVTRSGLDGRGGAGFPAWRKLTAIPRVGKPAVVIANGAEGEPLSVKDAALLTHAPHLVIDGLLLVAALVRSRDTHLYAGAALLPALRRQIARRPDAAGIHLHEAPDTFISGEASAVVNAIHTGRAIPTDRIVRLTSSGLRGRPTLVYNVETLAQLALISRYGPEWFQSIGAAGESGTRLLSITMNGTTRAIEAAGGTPIHDAISAAGFDAAAAEAVLVGGYHGAWLPRHALHTPLSRTALAPYGAAPGAGILLIIDRKTCGLRTGASIATYLASQSARQCGPCMNGLPRMADTLTRLASRTAHPSLEGEVRRLAALVAGRGSCHHPDGTARLVLSTLTVFANDVDAHLAGRCEKGCFR